MENRISESSTDRTAELIRRISEARTPQEFQDALNDMAVHLMAQRELAIKDRNASDRRSNLRSRDLTTDQFSCHLTDEVLPAPMDRLSQAKAD